MRVPSIGLPLDERRIVREAYRLAEYMLRDYRDPPTMFETIRDWFGQLRSLVSVR
jgi:hypothetical protein